MQIGDIIEITIPLPEGIGSKKIVVNGIAIRITGDGVALEFQDLEEETQRALLYFIEGAQA